MKKSHVVMIIISSVIFVFLIMIASSLNIGTNNDWIGFAGGVIGSFIGVFGVYWTMRADQKKREEERKEDFLSQNIEVFSNVVKALESGNFSKVSNNLTEIKQSKEWIRLDKDTKSSIEKIIYECRKSDEDSGFENAIYSSLLISCGDILQEQKKEFDESTGFSCEVFVPSFDYLKSLTSVIKTYSEEMINYHAKLEDFFESESQFIHYINKLIGLPISEKQYEELYRSVMMVTESEQWNSYMFSRDITFELIGNLKQSITTKIESLH